MINFVDRICCAMKKFDKNKVSSERTRQGGGRLCHHNKKDLSIASLKDLMNSYKEFSY